MENRPFLLPRGGFKPPTSRHRFAFSAATPDQRSGDLFRYKRCDRPGVPPQNFRGKIVGAAGDQTPRPLSGSSMVVLGGDLSL